MSDKQLEAMEKFRQVQIATKYVTGEEARAAISAAKDTPFLPRDLLTMAMYGRLFSIQIAGGPKLVPMAFKKDVSESLDTITQEPGFMMVRGPDFWEALPTGQPGQALFSLGPGVAPVWVNLALETEDVMISSTNNTTTLSTGAALLGNLFKPAITVFPSHIWAVVDAVLDASYKGFILRMDGDNVVEVIAEGPVINTPVAAITPLLFPFAAIPTMLAGTSYCVCVNRIDATTTSPPQLRRGDQQLSGFPTDTPQGRFNGAIINPVAGDTLGFTDDIFCRVCHLIYTI